MFFNLFKKSDKSEADKVNEASPETAVEVQSDVSEILDETLVENKKEPFEASAEVVAEAPVPAEPAPTKLGFFARIKQGLSRTSSHFAEGLGNLFLGRKSIDEDLFEELETQLLLADVGMEATSEIIDNLTARVARKQLNDADALYKALRDQLADLLKPVEQPLVVDSAKAPFVILVVGVNGVGKSFTIGKLAKRLQN